MDIKEYQQILRTEIDAALDLATQFSEVSESVPPRLRDAVRYSLLLPGKRLRPAMVLMAAEMCGGDRAVAMPAACAVEMVHAYSLIHDDLPAMDNDDLRRGQPTSHKMFGEATAILAGDALLTFAFETVLQCPVEQRAELALALARAAGPAGMVGGQGDDVFYEKKLSGLSVEGNDQRLLETIHWRKTGEMILVSLRLGALAAGVGRGDEKMTALETYGRSFGIAFQITDDLLDVTGDEKLMGKRLQKDADKGKLTFPGLYGIEKSRTLAEQEVETAVRALDIFGECPARKGLAGLAAGLLARKS